jgi:hypothetical protein
MVPIAGDPDGPLTQWEITIVRALSDAANLTDRDVGQAAPKTGRAIPRANVDANRRWFLERWTAGFHPIRGNEAHPGARSNGDLVVNKM